MDTRRIDRQPKAVVFDFDNTIPIGNLHNFLTTALHNKVNEYRKVNRQAELDKLSDFAILEKLGFYKDKVFNTDLLWQLIKEQLISYKSDSMDEETNLYPTKYNVPDTSIKITWKEIFAELNRQGILIGIASFNNYLPIIKRYLQEIIGLSDDCINNIYYEVCFPYNPDAASKVQYFNLLKDKFSAVSNTKISPAEIVIVDDSERHRIEAIFNGQAYITVAAIPNGQHLYDLRKYFKFLDPNVSNTMLMADELCSYLSDCFIFRGNECEFTIAAIKQHAISPDDNQPIKLGRLPEIFVKILNEYFDIDLVTEPSQYRHPKVPTLVYNLVKIERKDLDHLLKDFPNGIGFVFSLLQRSVHILNTTSQIDRAAMNAIVLITILDKFIILNKLDRPTFLKNISEFVIDPEVAPNQLFLLGRMPEKLLDQLKTVLGIAELITGPSTYRNPANPGLVYVKVNIGNDTLAKILKMDPQHLRHALDACVSAFNKMTIAPAYTDQIIPAQAKQSIQTLHGFLAPNIHPSLALAQMQSIGTPPVCIYRVDDKFAQAAKFRLNPDPGKKAICYNVAYLNKKNELEIIIFTSCERKPEEFNRLLISKLGNFDVSEAVIKELDSHESLPNKNYALVHLHSDKTLYPEEVLFEIIPTRNSGSALVISTQTPSEEAKSGDVKGATFGGTGCAIQNVLANTNTNIADDEKWIIITGHGDAGNDSLGGNYVSYLSHFAAYSTQGEDLTCSAAEYARIILEATSSNVNKINVLLYNCNSGKHSAPNQHDSFAYKLAENLAASCPMLGFTIIASKTVVNRFTGSYQPDEVSGECFAYRVTGGPANIVVVTKNIGVNAPIEEKENQFPNGFYITTQGLGAKQNNHVVRKLG